MAVFIVDNVLYEIEGSAESVDSVNKQPRNIRGCLLVHFLSA
jgi:hypothetical protein